MSELQQKVISQAVNDARGHQEEFPGQAIRGDWDSEAWTQVVHEMGLTSIEAEELWPVYSRTLRDTVNAAIGH